MRWAVMVLGFGLAGAAGAEEVAPGFEGLADMAEAAPQEVLALPAVRAAVQAAVGDDWPVYAAMMENPGKGGLQGADYYGSACPDPACDEGYGTLFVDPVAGAVYVAWTQDGQLFFRPTNGAPDDGWPLKAQEAYEFWPEM